MPSSISLQTRDLVARLLAAVAANDFDAIQALYAAAVDFRVNWPENEIGGRVPWIRHRHTASEMRQHFAELAEYNLPHGEGTTVEEIIVDMSEAVIFGTIRNRLAPDGKAYVALFALRLTVENGYITRHHVYEDSLSVFRAVEA